jgi:glycolate oxidase iron-sulfur subunit
MKTAFTDEQLARPGYAEAAGILKDCVHYGFCTAGCPTYVLTRDENDGPRGRIDLIKAMLEKGGTPDPRTVHHLDRCLSCLSCMTTCAVNVDYMHLADIGRGYIEEHYRRPAGERLLRLVLAQVLTRPRLMAAGLRLGAAARLVRALLPGRLRAMADLVPRKSRGEILPAGIHPAEGEELHRVLLLQGCAQQAIDGAVNGATIRLLRRHGASVVVASGSGCCGSLPLHMGRIHQARRLARANIAAWTEEPGIEAIVVSASGCGTTVKDYGHLFADSGGKESARRIAAMTRDVTEWVEGVGLREPVGMPEYRIAYHDPCSMRNVQKVTREPRDLLRRAGFDVRDIPEGHFCCGSAGTYNILQPDLAGRLGARKAEAIASVQPDIVVTGNIGCMVQIARHLGRPVVHTVEMLDWATGGPKPAALADTPLPDRPVRQSTTPSAPPAGAVW